MLGVDFLQSEPVSCPTPAPAHCLERSTCSTNDYGQGGQDCLPAHVLWVKAELASGEDQ